MFFRRKTSPEKRPLSEEKSSKGKPRAASGGRGGVGDPWGRIQAGEGATAFLRVVESFDRNHTAEELSSRAFSRCIGEPKRPT